MRNLKRALSLALAAIMVIGMMVIGAGAVSLTDFPDKDEIKNQDAVSLLSTLGIINGKDTGKFDPTGNVTRAEMAKMISVVLNGGADNNALYSDLKTGLTDIDSSWAKGHINFCFSRNIIAGRGTGKFDPTANVTAAEAAKMLLVAAGYDPSIEGFTGSSWSINVSAMASKLGMFKNFEQGKLMEPLTRDDAALIIYNALDVEMIQKYENGYPIAFEDNRTILSTTYGVYKVTGVVISNEYAALNGTDSDFASSTGKTTMENVKVYASTTQNTTVGEYEAIKGSVIFNATTTADMLGKTITLYVRKTTVLTDSQVIGVYDRGTDNVVKTAIDDQDTAKDFLKGTGLAVDSTTQYYVNFGHVAGEAAAQKAMGLDLTTGRFSSVTNQVNAYGIVMDVIDNDNDGVVEYVLYQQETLTQVVATNANKETTTLNTFNSNKAIDNDKIVTEDEVKEGDAVLAVSYGGRYYVSAPEIVTGKMDSFSSSKAKQQYIEVEGTKYYPSFIKYAADSVSNTYEFDILDCGKTDAVDFGISYDFIQDSNGSIIAYRPSEKGLYNYALILDSGYDPGRTNSNPTGEVKVLLPDGTIATYTLDFGASAQNVGNQLYNGLSTAANRKTDGTVELKGLLGTSVTDNTSTAPITGTVLKTAGDKHFSKNATPSKAGHAAGYVVGYSLNEEKVFTITSIVGTNTPVTTGADVGNDYTPVNSAKEKPISTKDKLTSDYDNGSARIKYGASQQMTIDQNTVAFYYTTTGGADKDETLYGVAVGYSKMSDVDTGIDFVSAPVKTSNLAATMLFNCEGVVAEKTYAYVLGTSSSTSTAVTLNVVLMDGAASTLKISRSDFDSVFADKGEDAFNTVYSFTGNPGGTDTNKVTLGTEYMATEIGYAVKLRDGTVAFYKMNADKTVGSYVDAYSYDKSVWNVEDIKVGDNAPSGGFAENIYKTTILVLDAKKNTVRAAYIKGVLSGSNTNPGGNFNWDLTNYKDMYPYNTIADIHKTLNEGYNVRMNGDFTLTSDLYVPSGKIFYTTGNLNEATFGVKAEGSLWVKGNYTTNGAVAVKTQVGGDMILSKDTTISSTVNVAGSITGVNKNLSIASAGTVYATGDVNIGTGTLTVDGHLEANNYVAGTGIVNSNKTLIARGNLTIPTLTIGNGANAGAVTVAGKLQATTVSLKVGTLTLNNSAAAGNSIGTLNTDAGTTMTARNVTVTTGGTVSGAVTVDGTLTVSANLTVSTGGAITTSKVDGTVTGAGGSVTITDKDSTPSVKGELSGTYTNLTLTGIATVATGKTATVNGKLTMTSEYGIAVTGTLVLNGEVIKTSKITGVKGGKVTFGNAATPDEAGANQFYYEDGKTVVAKADLKGMSFVAGEDGKFVSTAKAVETSNVTFALTSPKPGAINTIAVDQAKRTVNVTVEKGTESVTLALTTANGQKVKNGETEVNGTLTLTAETASAQAADAAKVFKEVKLVVSQDNKASITYTVNVTVSDKTPAPADLSVLVDGTESIISVYIPAGTTADLAAQAVVVQEALEKEGYTLKGNIKTSGSKLSSATATKGSLDVEFRIQYATSTIPAINFKLEEGVTEYYFKPVAFDVASMGAEPSGTWGNVKFTVKTATMDTTFPGPVAQIDSQTEKTYTVRQVNGALKDYVDQKLDTDRISLVDGEYVKVNKTAATYVGQDKVTSTLIGENSGTITFEVYDSTTETLAEGADGYGTLLYTITIDTSNIFFK